MMSACSHLVFVFLALFLVGGSAFRILPRRSATPIPYYAVRGCSSYPQEPQILDVTSTADVRCCSQDGSSCQSQTVGCPSGLTHAQASSKCAERGLRLCTKTELEADVCCGTGCMFDMKMIWTSSQALCKVTSDCSGVYECESGVCQPPVCSTTDGAAPSSAFPCRCGTSMCRDATESVCNATNSKCSMHKIGFQCRQGQGQPGQSYKVFAMNLKKCQKQCDNDDKCMGIDHTEMEGKPDACRLFGEHVARIGDPNAKDRQYCVKMDFDFRKATPVPGDGSFVPDLQWSREVLKVPVEDFECKQVGGGGINGNSGASYFKCSATYGGSAAFPALGLPTETFIKLRNPGQNVDEFKCENAVDALAKYLPQRPPLVRMLASDRNYIMMENMGVPVEGSYKFTKKEQKTLLKSYAAFHAAFWGLGQAPGIQTQQNWAQIFAGQMVPLEGQVQLLDFFGLPEPQNGLMKRVLVEIGMPAILAHMNRFGMTLVQGDAHAGQVLRLRNDNSAKQRGFEWGLIDFAWAHLGSPAIDVGNFMMWPSVESVDHAEFVKFYFDQLVEFMGCSQPGSTNPQKLPSCSLEDFIKDCRIAATFRGLMTMAFTSFSFPEEARRDKDYLAKNPHFTDWFAGTHRGFRFFDQSTFDYLLERTGSKGSSFMDLSVEVPRKPPQSVVNAMTARFQRDVAGRISPTPEPALAQDHNFPVGMSVCIRSPSQQYLTDHEGRPGLAKECKAWESWTILDAGDGKVTIRSHRNEYLQDDSGHVGLSRNEHEWATWTIASNCNGMFSIRSHRNQYLLDDNGHLGLSRTLPIWQTWSIVAQVANNADDGQ